jgi:hypothetical protein
MRKLGNSWAKLVETGRWRPFLARSLVLSLVFGRSHIEILHGSLNELLSFRLLQAVEFA